MEGKLRGSVDGVPKMTHDSLSIRTSCGRVPLIRLCITSSTTYPLSCNRFRIVEMKRDDTLNGRGGGEDEL